MNIKYILVTLFTLFTLFTGVNVDEPVRLQKQVPKKNIKSKLNDLIQRKFYIIALASIIVALLVFVICCFMIVGISATESGMVYNNLQKVI